MSKLYLRSSLIAAVTLLASAAQGQGAADFYKGKDVRILFGAGVGGTYGLYGQLAARQLRKHIPGAPNLIIQSMPGAGGKVALNYSHNVAPKDGTLMHLVHAEVVFETLLTKGVTFNAANYQYIGRMTDADGIALATKASKVRSLDDARKRQVTMGSTGADNVFSLGPLMLNRVGGTKFKIVAGYKGSSDIVLAMQRGELDGAGMTLANALTSHGDKIQRGELVPFFVIGANRLKQYPDVPAMTEFGSSAEKTLMEIYASAGVVGRSLAFPPGVPGDRLAAVRTAFQAMLVDADFKAEVEKTKVLIAPMSGEELEAYVGKMMKTPGEDLASARKIHEELLTTK